MFTPRQVLMAPEGDVGGAGASGSGEGVAGAGAGGAAVGDGEIPVWMEGLPEELTGEASLLQFQGVDGLAKSYIETKRMVGNSIRLPNGEAGPEAWAEFDARLQEKIPGLVRVDLDNPESVYTALGRPEEPTGYAPPSFDEGTSFNPERIESFKPIAHKHGLTAKQFAGVVADMVAMENGVVADMRGQTEAAMGELRAKEGQRFDETMGLAGQFLNTIGREHGYTMKAEQLTPREIAMYADVMRRFGSEGAGAADGGGAEAGNGRLTPAQAREEIDAIRGNSEHPYNNRLHPGHEGAKRRMRELYVLEQGAHNEVLVSPGGVGGSVQR